MGNFRKWEKNSDYWVECFFSQNFVPTEKVKTPWCNPLKWFSSFLCFCVSVEKFFLGAFSVDKFRKKEVFLQNVKILTCVSMKTKKNRYLSHWASYRILVLSSTKVRASVETFGAHFFINLPVPGYDYLLEADNHPTYCSGKKTLSVEKL